MRITLCTILMSGIINRSLCSFLLNSDIGWNPLDRVFQGVIANQIGNVMERRLFATHIPFTKQLQSVSSVAQSYPTLCDPKNHGTPGLPVHHQLPESTQSHVHWVGDAIQPSHPLSSPYLPALNPSQHQGLFKWVSSLHQVAKVLEFQLQHQSFQWIFRADFL